MTVNRRVFLKRVSSAAAASVVLIDPMEETAQACAKIFRGPSVLPFCIGDSRTAALLPPPPRFCTVLPLPPSDNCRRC